MCEANYRKVEEKTYSCVQFSEFSSDLLQRHQTMQTETFPCVSLCTVCLQSVPLCLFVCACLCVCVCMCTCVYVCICPCSHLTRQKVPPYLKLPPLPLPLSLITPSSTHFLRSPTLQRKAHLRVWGEFQSVKRLLRRLWIFCLTELMTRAER